MLEHRRASTNGREPSVDGGKRALKAENADLRATNQRMRDGRGVRWPAYETGTELTEVRLPLNTEAPAAARAIVASKLRDRSAAPAFDHAQLLTSELVTNGVLHSDASEGVLV